MARATIGPIPDTVRLLETAGREYATIEYDWLPAEERAVCRRIVREIAGTFVITENATSGSRCACVTVLGLDNPLQRGEFDQLLRILTDEEVQTIRFRVLKPESNAAVVGWLKEAGFQRKQGMVHWLSPTDMVSTAAEGHDIRQADPEALPEFARIVAINYRYKPGTNLAPLIHRTKAPGTTCFLAYMGGEPVGTGSINRLGTVCDFGFGTTLKAYRGRGIQQAMIATRVHYAKSIGCAWATASTMGLDWSSRNLVRQSFCQAYTMLHYER